MLIKSLRLLNFRQFKNKTNVTFSCDTSKNVTIILGDNTFGKTTLLQAFNWCLYKKVLFEDNPNFLLNLEVSEALPAHGQANVEVEVSLSHNGGTYTITRTQKYTRYADSVLPSEDQPCEISYNDGSGNTSLIRPSEVNNVIRKILPEELSDYFFFDTERVRSISQRTDLTDAVKGLLGLTPLENALKHIGNKNKKNTVIGKLYASMDEDGDTKSNAALKLIENEQDNQDVLQAQLENCDDQLKKYAIRQEELEEILRANPDTKPLQRQKEARERDVADEEKRCDKYISRAFQDFDAGVLRFFAQPLLQQAMDYLQAVDISDKGIKDLTAVTIDEILKRGICICGRLVEEGNEAYLHLQEEKKFVPPESIGTTVRYFKEKLSTFGAQGNRVKENINDMQDSLLRSRIKIQEWRDEVEDLSAQLLKMVDVSQYESELVSVKVRIREQQKKRENLLLDMAESKHKAEQARKIYDSLVAVSGKNKSTIQYIAYAEELFRWIYDAYHAREIEIRDLLEVRVNNIFARMYHGTRRVVINPSYHVTLMATVQGREMETGESEGLNRVKNFAFIAGLVDLAKEKTAKKTEIELGSESFPLVMDAPFSNADETHIRNISRVLPEVAEQVIMFVMEKDWKYARDTMDSHVGSTYHLTKHTDTYTELG